MIKNNNFNEKDLLSILIDNKNEFTPLGIITDKLSDLKGIYIPNSHVLICIRSLSKTHNIITSIKGYKLID